MTLCAVGARGQNADAEKTALMVEALNRLPPEQVQANPKLQEALAKVLLSTRGTAAFVQLVQKFQVKGQNDGLLEYAAKNPGEELAGAAVRQVLDDAGANDNAIASALSNTNAAQAIAIAAVLGQTHDRRILPLLERVLAEPGRDPGLRKQAVRSLVEVQEGASLILKMAKEDKLAADLKFTATTELNAARWPAIKDEAAKILPLPQGQNTQPLPPVSELLKMSGDAKHGETVFSREEVGCIKCHKVRDKGVDFGPALTEIGTKLGKDALLESILEPSAGVSFGFEAWQIELKSGDDAFGLIVSETVDEITLKDAKAIPMKIKKSDIKSRQQSKLSIMPAGLQQTMSTQDLVDLLEYLAGLKKQ
jgi:putative heme-binding domain-containing protein